MEGGSVRVTHFSQKSGTTIDAIIDINAIICTSWVTINAVDGEKEV